jgi:formylglycine-generating enzyme required for sulfatase activity
MQTNAFVEGLAGSRSEAACDSAETFNPFSIRRRLRAAPLLAVVSVAIFSGCRHPGTQPGCSNPPVKVFQPQTRRLEVAGVAFEFVAIPSGDFQMGCGLVPDAQPVHPVRLRGFELSRTEVTVEQFRAFADATGYRTDAEKDGRGPGAWTINLTTEQWSWTAIDWRRPGFPISDADPAVCLSWNDAVAYCQWLSEVTGDAYRLPTEAEWEYAACAGAGVDELTAIPIPLVAWYAENSGGRTHPVGQKESNAWGLRDMLGNAWEWCADRWHNDYRGAPGDGSAWGSESETDPNDPGECKVMRGGGWGLGSQATTFWSRATFGRVLRCNNSGFRIARSL